MRITKSENVHIVVIDRSLDSETAPNVQDVLLDLVDEGARTILCDFSETTYISSRGLRAVIAAAKRLKNIGGEMVFCSVEGNVGQIFDISGFNRIFRIFDGQSEALRELTPLTS